LNYELLKIKIMRKKDLFGFFLMALAMSGTGCTNDQLAEQESARQAISFRTQGGMPTLRSTATTQADIDAFVVYGGDNVTPGIFTATSVVKEGATWLYSPKRYYSAEATTANFFAYSPIVHMSGTGGNGAFNVKAANCADADTLVYKVPLPASDGKIGQVDLLVAKTTSHPVATTPVPLAFKHALARVFVKATSLADETITITGLTLQYLFSEGTLIVDGTTTSTGGGTNPPSGTALTWSLWGTKANYPYVLAASGVAVNKTASANYADAVLLTSMEQGMMVLPQSVGSGVDNTFRLVVNYDIVGVLAAQEAQIKLAEDFTFEAGKQYAITVNFAANNVITFSVTVEEFTDIATVTYPAP
jgi:hypothetical protein